MDDMQSHRLFDYHKIIISHKYGTVTHAYAFCLVTPGPGSYILPSDFGYLDQTLGKEFREPNTAMPLGGTTKFLGKARVPRSPATPAQRPRLVSRL